MKCAATLLDYLKDVCRPDTSNLAWILWHVMTHNACLSVLIIILALTHICQCLAARASGQLMLKCVQVGQVV